MSRILLFSISISISISAFSQDLLPHIGLETEPTPDELICDIPLYLDPFETVGFFEGESVNDFTLFSPEGEEFTLADALQDKPVLLVSGSYTCPVYRNKSSILNQVVQDYGGIVEVALIYTVEAHPFGDISPYFGYENPGNANIQQGILYAQPTTYGERLDIIDDMLEAMNIDFPIYVDGPCNAWLETFGPAPNTAYLIDQDGYVISRHPWLDAYPDDIICDIEIMLDEDYECPVDVSGGFQYTMDSDTLIQGDAGTTISVYGTLYNPTNAPVLIECTRTDLDLPLGWSSSMCLDICLQTDETYREVLLQPGESQSYTNYFYTTEESGIGVATIEFQNSFHANNNVVQSFYGEVVGSGVEEMERELVIYPNPSSGSFNVSGAEEGIILVMDARGQFVFRDYIGSSGLLSVKMDELNPGIYIVNLPGGVSKAISIH